MTKGDAMLPITEPLSPAEQFELGRRAAAGDESAREELIVRFRPLVLYWANRMGKGRRADIDDLYGEGCIALVRAAKHWDHSRGYLFTSYASPAIIRAMRRQIYGSAHNDGTVRAGNSDGSTSRSVRCRNLTDLGDDDGDPINDSLAMADSAAHVIGEIVRGEDAAEVRAAVGRLEKRLADVLSLRVGLDGTPRTLEECGAVLGVTRERIRQLENRAIYFLAREYKLDRPASTLGGKDWAAKWGTSHYERRIKA